MVDQIQDDGQVHEPKAKFGRVPLPLLHNPKITDGAVRLYAHMLWRFGNNKKNYEGRQSMAEFMDVSEATITNRVAELVQDNWVIAIPRAKVGGGRETNYYHVFMIQKDCQEYREVNGLPKPQGDACKVATRKNRKGKGGRPSHKNGCAKVNSSSLFEEGRSDDLPKRNSSSLLNGNSSSHLMVNSSSRNLDTENYIDVVSYIDAGDSPKPPIQVILGSNAVLAQEESPLQSSAKGSPLLPAVIAVPAAGGALILADDFEFQLLRGTVSVLCGVNYAVTPSAEADVIALYQGGVKADHVIEFNATYWPTIWPGNKGEPLTLPALKENIARAQHDLDRHCPEADLSARIAYLRKCKAEGLPVDFDELRSFDLSTGLLAGEAARVQAEQDRYQAEWDRLNCGECDRPRDQCVCEQKDAIPGRVKSWWQALIGQLQIQLNPSTYGAWVRPLEVVGYAPGKLFVEAPHTYGSDWVNQHLLASMTRNYNDMYQPARCGEPEIVIEVRARPEPVEPEIQQERG